MLQSVVNDTIMPYDGVEDIFVDENHYLNIKQENGFTKQTLQVLVELYDNPVWKRFVNITVCGFETIEVGKEDLSFEYSEYNAREFILLYKFPHLFKSSTSDCPVVKYNISARNSDLSGNELEGVTYNFTKN